MDPNGNGKRGLPLLREIIRRQRQDSDIFFSDSRMNPFNASTDNKETVKKKEQPSASTSSDLLIVGNTRIRKPFHQIYLEEIARNSKSPRTEMENPEDLACSREDSAVHVTAENENIALSSSQPFISELPLKQTVRTELLKVSKLEQNNDLENSSIQNEPTTSKKYIKEKNDSQYDDLAESLKKLRLTDDHEFDSQINDCKTESKTKSLSSTSVISNTLKQSSQSVSQIIANHNPQKEFKPYSSISSLSGMKSRYISSENIDIFKPLEIPQFVKSPTTHQSQSVDQIKHEKKTEKTELQPSTSQVFIPKHSLEVYRKQGAIPKSFSATGSQISQKNKHQKSMANVTEKRTLSVSELQSNKSSKCEKKKTVKLPLLSLEGFRRHHEISTCSDTLIECDVPSVSPFYTEIKKQGTLKSNTNEDEVKFLLEPPNLILDIPKSEEACSLIPEGLKEKDAWTFIPHSLDNFSEGPSDPEFIHFHHPEEQRPPGCNITSTEICSENFFEVTNSVTDSDFALQATNSDFALDATDSDITIITTDSEFIAKTDSLGDFNKDLGEAILDSIFFGDEEDYYNSDYFDDYDDEDEYDFDDYSDDLAKLSDFNKETKTAAAVEVKEPSKFQTLPKSFKKSDGGQGGGADSSDLEFVYDDTDTHGNEIAELYSYTEQSELQLNVKAFEDQMESYNLPPSWQRLSVEKRRSVIMKLLDQLEISKKPLRMNSARCLLYIAQGCWAEMQSDTEQQHWARINCMLLYQLGAFSAFTDLLNIEIENCNTAHLAMRKVAVSLADSQDLRVILSVLYTITEVIRNERTTDNSEYKNEIEAFCYDIGNATGDDLLVIKLLGMVTRFCSGASPHFPMKKVLLLLWKLILVSLGGMVTLKDLKAEKRMRANLTPQDEDTMEIAKTMRSSSPPASASDLLEAQNQKRSTRPFRRSLMKQSSLDDQETLGMEMETTMSNDNGEDLADMAEYDERRPTDSNETGQMYNNHNINMYNRQMSPPPQHAIIPRGLPWKPKVRQKDIDMFLDGARQKFLGYSLPGDQATLFGLPEPIHEGVNILKEHIYTSLAELQIQKEEEIARNPLSTEEEEIDLTPAEMLYQAMLPNLPQYMIALLKILLAAAPTSKAKTDSINIMADVLPEEMPMTVLQSMKLGIDVNRHKEIIVKAVSAVLLLLLKHFKLNHIYQFEFMSQHLVFANCIPLVLKFFNQNIMAYVGAKNIIPILDFPSCVIGDQPELTAESLEIGDAALFSWRNMFSCINLLRILNKLTKWKHSRIMMLVVFKSAPILKRTLKVRHAMTQLYVLKLLKMQTKYLGRQWRKSNMKTISAIYQKVRHRLNDDWAYGNDLDARPWDFQAEECALRASVDRFNNRRYSYVNESDFEPVDNCLSSVLGTSHELSENFKTHYLLWLEQEVFGAAIEWDKLVLDDDTQ